jgi:thiosulfate/3-mercaptopyruvate sulfurtransferase
MPVVSAEDIEAGKVGLLLDARAGERYRGEVEPIDKRAGHIPGAVSSPLGLNVGPDMRFLPSEELRARYDALARKEGIVACHCGSGVTATLNVLAMEVAGLPTPALYPGSWSEWSYPLANRPIRVGPDP